MCSTSSPLVANVSTSSRRSPGPAFASGCDRKQRAAGRHEPAHVDDRLAARRVGERLHGDDFDDEVKGPSPLGRWRKQSGRHVVHR
jgi:hypothetical protein